MGLFNKLFRGAPRIGLSNEDRGAAKIADDVLSRSGHLSRAMEREGVLDPSMQKSRLFGSGIGAGFAYAIHANKGIRNAARDLSHAALGVNKTVRKQIGSDLDVLKNKGLDDDKNILNAMKNYKKGVDHLDGISGINTDFLRGSGFSKIHKDDVVYATGRVFEDVMNESGVATKGRVDAARKLFEKWN